MTLEEQFIENESKIKTYLFHKTSRNKELAEDLFQELYIKLRRIADSGKYVEEGKFMNFIKRIASNMLIDHHRAETRLNTFRESDWNNLTNEPNRTGYIFDLLLGGKEDEPYIDTWVSDEMADKLEKAIETLPLAQKELVTMRYYRNMTYKEIVLETGEKQANLLPRMFHAKKNLRKILCND